MTDVSNPILGADFLALLGLFVDVQRRRILHTDTSLHAAGAVMSSQVHSVEVIISADVVEGPSFLKKLT